MIVICFTLKLDLSGAGDDSGIRIRMLISVCVG